MIVRCLTKERTEDDLISKLEAEVTKPREELKTIIRHATEKLREGGAIIE